MSRLTILSIIIFGLNVVMWAVLKNWAAVGGFICALLWIAIAETERRKNATTN